MISQKTIVGEFTATVRDLVPNYVLDDITPLCAVITDFQDSPFTIDLNEELVAQIEPGKTYVFEIKEQLIEPIYKSNGDFVELTPEVAVAIYNIQVNAVRVPSESEMGLESNRLYIK